MTDQRGAPVYANALPSRGSRLRRWRFRLERELRHSDVPETLGLGLLSLALTAAGIIWPALVSYIALLIPMFLASLWLGPRRLPWFVVFNLACVLLLVGTQPAISWRTLVRLVTIFVIAYLILFSSFRRSRLGVSGPRSESMFVDLQDRIAKQGQMPRLPHGWYLQTVTRSSGGTSFAGDFVVASAVIDDHVELVVVDVSGKGVDAGTRALLLSGAFGGLLSALSPAAFLPAANEYLLRQDWDEGFATAIHLHLDLVTGAFELRKAGHPPGVWLHAGSGRWTVADSDGPILGLIEGAEFDCVRGTLASGDALLLYTDGLVETTDRDINSGIDKLAGRGQRLFQSGFEDGARTLINDLGSHNDDQALVLLHRR